MLGAEMMTFFAPPCESLGLAIYERYFDACEDMPSKTHKYTKDTTVCMEACLVSGDHP